MGRNMNRFFKLFAFGALSLGLVQGALVVSGQEAVVAQVSQAKAVVDAAKAAGLIGERYDGFIGFVKPSNDPVLKAAVAEINAARQALYAEVERKNGVTAGVAGASAYSNQIFPRMPSGYYYMDATNEWKIR